ncbi:DUF257 family protein [Thermococcus stetteri]|uniref:DUF257 family protein n=1 Tax=Thermococcus stetteri TaxID=49900 RepID=UPI001AE17727|nr:DUF257 family protein [Thermococcus stetteri]MBP1911377.1 hypothetical protein [Thermococcus stetteri]
MNFSSYLERIKPGETVLIEHTSISPHPLLFYEIGSSVGWDNLLVIDILDSTLPILRRLRLSGREVPENEIARIKAGGTSLWGKLVIEVNPHKDPGIFMSRFVSNVLNYYRRHKNVTTIIVNPERIIPLQDNRPSFVLYLTNVAAEFLGNTDRKTFYFVNYELAHRGYLALLEEIFTRVLRVEDGSVEILKSLNLEEEGTRLQLE